MSLGRPRRRRRSGQNLGFLLLLLIGTGAVGAALWYGYTTLSQDFRQRIATLETEAARLDAALADSEQAKGRLAVALEETRARLRYARTRYDRDVPQGPALRLHELTARMLDDGVSAERLAFLIRLASRPLTCASEPETRRLRLGVEGGLVEGTVARVADGALIITGTGTAARDQAGRPEAWFDPAQPVSLNLTRPGGGQDDLNGVLPLNHTVPLEGAEYRVEASVGETGMVDLSVTRCSYW